MFPGHNPGHVNNVANLINFNKVLMHGTEISVGAKGG